MIGGTGIQLDQLSLRILVGNDFQLSVKLFSKLGNHSPCAQLMMGQHPETGLMLKFSNDIVQVV